MNNRTMPMHILTAFAAFSTCRQAEMGRITWDGDVADAQRAMVRRIPKPHRRAIRW
ncbi:hypothetical protein Q4577_02850 [Marinovum sp. 2_MG-2023]|nr:hypothetical protein [Marinovum sp. 2_MG-2023]MDO6777645.1 hypothetical protein [Marinovum sp. 1_MG-2023]